MTLTNPSERQPREQGIAIERIKFQRLLALRRGLFGFPCSGGRSNELSFDYHWVYGMTCRLPSCLESNQMKTAQEALI